ncbi:uncharacterized protein LOC126810476 [Patella vulgata]|uniref:uncharacterized protein LOC126810476 n=1 Tax=Patella vulgata TaxID=6465 RepID=UPI0021802BC1|nr:uncharacterized protein LOC126810476 [Patella vulgata]
MSQQVRQSLEKYPHHKVLLLAIAVSVLGLACILVAIVGFTLRVWGHYMGTGLWCGTVIFAAGISGIISSQFKGAKSVKCYFGCSCFAIVMSLIMIVMSSAGLDYSSNFYKHVAYFKVNHQKSTFYVHVAALTFSLLSLMGNITALFLCARHDGFYQRKSKKYKMTWSSSRRTNNQSDYLRASTNSRSDLQEREISSGSAGGPNSKETPKLGTIDRTRRKDSSSSRRSSSDQQNRGCRSEKKHSRRHSQGNPPGPKQRSECSVPVHKDSLDDQRKTKQQSYRSLPHRSRRPKSRPPCEVEANAELLPTAFNEDELPSYTDAIKQPPLPKERIRNYEEDKANEEFQLQRRLISPLYMEIQDRPQLSRRDSQRNRGNVGYSEPRQSDELSHELRQNLQNEEAEQIQNVTETDSSIPSTPRLSFKNYITASPLGRGYDITSVNPNVLNIRAYPDRYPQPQINRSLTQNLPELPAVPNQNLVVEQNNIPENHDECVGAPGEQACDMNVMPINDKRPAFNALNSDINISPSLPITIGSPRSAFRPVKRRSSQRSVNESHLEEGATSALSTSPETRGVNRSISEPNANVWKNILLPSTVRPDRNGEPDLDTYTHAAADSNLQPADQGASFSPDVNHHHNMSSFSANMSASNQPHLIRSNIHHHGIQEYDHHSTVGSQYRPIPTSIYNTLPIRLQRNAPQISSNSTLMAYRVPLNRHHGTPPLEQPYNRQNQQHMDQSQDSDLPFYSQIL